MWHMYTLKYQPAVKLAGKWIELEKGIRSGVIKAGYIFSFRYKFQLLFQSFLLHLSGIHGSRKGTQEGRGNADYMLNESNGVKH